MTVPFFRSLLCAGVAAVGFAPALQAQIAEAGFPTSILTAHLLHFGPSLNQYQQTWGVMPQFNFGMGDAGNGVAGNVLHGYTGGLLTNITINVNELRNTPPAHNYNDPFGRIYGHVLLTPVVNTAYTIGGSVDMVLSGFATSSSSTSGSVWLEQVSGPVLATFGGSLSRNTTISTVGSIYDSAAPLSGSATGTLLAGVTYRFGWDVSVGSLYNGDSSLYANVYTVSGQQSISISFAPTPGAGAVLALGGLAAGRRRRR
ncbi:MAG: hypothetical protein Q8L55_15450 [Phycisphaerales bacterium]|nr:hypothetical protein [Phycisphaerales bacterium]